MDCLSTIFSGAIFGREEANLFCHFVDPSLTSKQNGGGQDTLNEFAAHAPVQCLDPLFPYDGKNTIDR
jgi:hypothetical protein